MTTQREITLLRYVPSSSPVHRMWAGTKIAALFVLGVAVFAKPLWTSIAVIWVVVAAFAFASRLPRGVIGHPPRWIWVGIGVAGALSLLAFGKPDVHIAGATIGLGGLLDFLRFTMLGLALVAMGMLLGWTTPLADVAGAVDRLAAPARALRLPVDEMVLAIGLSVRCLPLLTGDVGTLRAAWRVRAPVRRMTLRDRVQELRDLLVAVLVSSLRRAREMAEAIDARGGPRGPYRSLHARRVRLGAPDAVATAVVCGAIAAIVLL